MEQYESELPDNKVVIVVDMGVGKTTILHRFLTEKFTPDENPTIGALSTKVTVFLGDGSTINLTIWDTAGQERYQSLIPLYLRNACVIVLVCDVTVKNTIQTLDTIFLSLINSDSSIITYLVANKIDLDIENGINSTYPELRQWANGHGMLFMTVSAKTGLGVDDLFLRIGTSIDERRISTTQNIRGTKSKRPCC
jgi:Ras-related protein Rab-5C